MAKPDAPNATPVEDLDDMVYVSDSEGSKEPVIEVKPGMISQVKNLYPGEKDDRGRFTTTDKIPVDLPEPEETDETARYALLIRNNKCYDGRKSLSIASIVVQSPLLKKALCWVLKDYPCMAPELDRLEIVFPFRPFVHRWERLTEALNDERDPETKSHIQLFYDALKKELEVTLEARDDFIAHKTITFNSLWMIFEPGEIVYTNMNRRPIAAKLRTGCVFQGRHEDLYRLECDMIYGNGKMFGWGHPRFDIPEFDGMTKITDLVTYPLKYHPKVDKVKNQLTEKGRAYEKLMGFHHKQYQGVALDVNQPFYVDSRIIIDPDAYRCYNPDYDLNLKPLKKIRADGSTDLADSEEDSQQSEDSSDEDESSKDGQAKNKSIPRLTEDQLLLCGSSVKGYSLRNKRWLDFFVDCIKEIEWDDHAWDNVVLEDDLKDLVISMTKGHRQKHRGLQSKGLNILLSGYTGVGKTFTVESVAEALKAPLFQVTPADVDLDAKNPDLESPFTDILEMCGRWNAILLFDQGQSVLDSDTLDDEEGREYSILLDALESHSAAFFVTCNVAAEDCMDDRLQSRFHVCLQLPELTLASRGQIWQKCLEAHKDMSFFANPDALADWKLNGREIANAVIAAKTLAMNGVIEMKHLERVVPASKRPIPVVGEWDSAVKKDKKKKSKKTAIDVEKGQAVDVVEIIEELPKKDDAWAVWGFGAKRDQKAGAKSTVVEPEKEPEKAPRNYDNTWGFGKIEKKDKKPKKSSKGTTTPPPPPPPPMEAEATLSDAELDDVGGSFGVKKEKKSEKFTPIGAEGMMPSHEQACADPVPAPPERDEWDFWASSKKSKKSKKKVVVDDAPSVVEYAGSTTASIPNRPPPPLSYVGCRTCVEYEPVFDGHSCKRCGTHKGKSKMVCEGCALTKGYNQFEFMNLPCEVCGKINP